jgi:DNA polymerase-3 subunit gamma/tau
MTLLRMLAFRPATETSVPAARSTAGSIPTPATPRVTAPGPAPRPEAVLPRSGLAVEAAPRSSAGMTPAPVEWPNVVRGLDLRGPARQLADSCDLQSNAGGAWQLLVPADKEHLNTQQLRARLEAALREQHGRDLRLTIAVGKPARPTPAEVRRSSESARMREVRETIEADPNVKAVQAAFDATLEPDSIRSSK